MKDQFDALSRTDTEDAGTADLLAEAALRCADLATLAACNISELSEGAAAKAAASAHLAAGTAHALSLLAESLATELEDPYPGNVRRDARGVRWRTDLAIRQVDELTRGISRT